MMKKQISIKTYISSLLVICLLFICGCKSSTNSSNEEEPSFYNKGYAAFYKLEENGTLTSSNIRYEKGNYVAAHKSLPYGTYVKVTNLNNGRVAFVTIIDHNMPDGDYVIKLSEKAASELAASSEHEFTIDLIKLG